MKTTEVGGERGFDGGKLVKGRKRHIVVDTMGNLIKAFCSAANLTDQKGALRLLEDLPQRLWKRMNRIWADGGYRGDVVEWVKDTFAVLLASVLRCDDQKGFKVVPWRWVVERTFAWLGNYRRLSKDYEFFCENSESIL